MSRLCEVFYDDMFLYVGINQSINIKYEPQVKGLLGYIKMKVHKEQ